MTKKKIKVLIYLPFFSGACEARHARMHDVLQSLNEKQDLPFDYLVIAERGRSCSSDRVRYLDIPLLRKYTETYIKPPRRIEPQIAKNVEDASQISRDSVGARKVKGHDAYSSAAHACRAQGERVSGKGCDPSYVESVSVNQVESVEEDLRLDSLSFNLRRERESSFLFIGLRFLKLLARVFLRLAKRLFRVFVRTLRKARFRVRQFQSKFRRLVVRLIRDAFNGFRVLQALLRGDAYDVVWKWCQGAAIKRASEQEDVDILHIVRPNNVSNEMLQVIRKKNPSVRVIIGPNLMSYGHPSNGFDYRDFDDSGIKKIIAISTYHKQLLEEFGFSVENITRLPPSVNPNHFRLGMVDHKVVEKRSEFTVLFAASQLAVEKGAMEFIQAIKAFVNLNGSCIRAIVVGGVDVNEEVQTPLPDSVLKNLPPEIELVGKVSRDKMTFYYNACDVFVHCGEPENGPTTIIEALACGAYCLLPDHICFKEPEFGDQAHYYEKGNIQQLIEKLSIIRLLVQGAKREFYLKQTHEDTISYLVDLYARVANDSG